MSPLNIWGPKIPEPPRRLKQKRMDAFDIILLFSLLIPIGMFITVWMFLHGMMLARVMQGVGPF
jgi:hypothetical protein